MYLVAYLSLESHAWNTFVVPHTDGQDDTPGLTGALANFTSNSTILFQKGVTYNIFTPVEFPKLTNVEVAIEGNLTYPSDIPTVQAIVAISKAPGVFSFSGGDNVTLRGSTDPDWGWVDAHGQGWWDTMEQTNRPHGWSFSKISNGVIRDMKIWKPIAWSFATSGSSNLHAFNNIIMAVSDNSSAFPFNTDGFSAGGTNMLFENNRVVNGDDCITVGSGASNIHFRNSYCEGGHGLSIGSLGENGAVSNVQDVLFENVIMKDTLYAARFKSWAGGNGLARNITWKDIVFDNVPFPIYVTQNYWDQELGAQPNSTNTTSTHIEDMTFQNFAGTIRDTPYVEGSCVSDPCWYYVANATGKEVIIFDLYPGTVTDIVAKAISATTETGSVVDVMCDPTTVTNDVGFKCWDGAYIPTVAGL
ncbi:pectin lyase-like protein [Guyanagaster necrorhizus]|uniref:galacturonan 1,4-alpha-galacturonidase n=1 Tax=Guyanagaster necrorhizus TaxID=856835 RepID=A0A9P7W479_9AGAR|nr:pectin lyase-like protein [Guyanagaster necrorhizus MCA 3950]KAG7451868.1 pectin lyase-like protein [Guyanagaster necrorhizus MCA 3950]